MPLRPTLEEVQVEGKVGRSTTTLKPQQLKGVAKDAPFKNLENVKAI